MENEIGSVRQQGPMEGLKTRKYPSVMNRHLGYFQLLAIANTRARNARVFGGHTHLFCRGYLPRSEVVGLSTGVRFALVDDVKRFPKKSPIILQPSSG